MITEITLIQDAVSKVFGDFVSKAVSDGVDISIKGIKEADQNRKPYSQNLQTQLYHVIIDALNRFTYNQYKKEDKLYDAAESILKEFKSNKDSLETMKSGLKKLGLDVNSDTCQNFLEMLCYEICKDENSGLYKEMDMLWKKQEKEYIHGVLENLNDLKEVLAYIIKYINDQEVRHYEIPIKNRAEEYADKWDKNVFLNDFNKRDKNAGVSIKLRNIYLEEHLPHYVWRTEDDLLNDLKTLLKEYIIDKVDKQMLLILGQPGIGKSTLITWIMANLAEKQDEILVYQFASDLGNVNWQGNNILNDIFKAIGYSYRELEGKTLILDGFDEIHIHGDNRERILSKMNQELKRMNFLKVFSLIITCRQNYVEQSQLAGSDYITLQAWNEEQIKSFCEVYEKENARKNPEAVNNKNLKVKINKILEKKEIFGIPLILYMVLALKVNVDKSSSMVDIYDQIFSLKRGGIYARCYDVEHRINSPEIREHVHQVSQRIAFWIFENNSEKASIPQKEFNKICANVINDAGERNEDLQSDVMISNYFTTIKHCEGMGTDDLQFVHRSIYEYFVTVYFFESIHKLTSEEKAAGKLGELLKYGRLSKQILDFIKYKFDSMKEYDLSDITREVFAIMLRDGMTYHTKERYINVIEREMYIFSNMLEIVYLWNLKLGEFDNIVFYLQHNYLDMLKLRGAYLSGAYLSRAYLRGAYLSEAHLSRVDLRGAYLSGAYLRGAYLSGADLRGAYLSGADLNGTHLNGTDLRRADLNKAHLREAHLREAHLRGADLRGTDLREADLREADLREADLSGVDLSGADLSGTIFNKHQVDLLCKVYDLNNSNVYIYGIDKVICNKEYQTENIKHKYFNFL